MFFSTTVTSTEQLLFYKNWYYTNASVHIIPVEIFIVHILCRCNGD